MCRNRQQGIRRKWVGKERQDDRRREGGQVGSIESCGSMVKEEAWGMRVGTEDREGEKEVPAEL